MKKLVRNLLLFALCVIAVDILFGFACRYVCQHSQGGEIGTRNYVCMNSSEDILIMGSSRAHHHYVPSVFDSILHCSSFNCGADGNGIILFSGMYKMISNRYTPKLIIYDLETFDMYGSDDEKYLTGLRPYYNEPGISDIFDDVSSTEKFKMRSQMYRYNSYWVAMFGDFFQSKQIERQGYEPLYGTINYIPEEKSSKRPIPNPLKIAYLENFIQDVRHNGTDLVFVVSPKYLAISDNYYTAVENLCAKYGIPLWNYMDDAEISTDSHLFKDAMHLNDTGAKCYSTMIAERIKTSYRI